MLVALFLHMILFMRFYLGWSWVLSLCSNKMSEWASPTVNLSLSKLTLSVVGIHNWTCLVNNSRHFNYAFSFHSSPNESDRHRKVSWCIYICSIIRFGPLTDLFHQIKCHYWLSHYIYIRNRRAYLVSLHSIYVLLVTLNHDSAGTIASMLCVSFLPSLHLCTLTHRKWIDSVAGLIQ